MDFAWWVMCAWVIRAALLWASIAVVARHHPRNRFTVALVWSAVMMAMQELENRVLDADLVLAIVCYGGMLAILMVAYRLGPLRAIGALVLHVATWLGSMYAVATVLARDTALCALTIVTLAILAIWIGAALRAGRSVARPTA